MTDPSDLTDVDLVTLLDRSRRARARADAILDRRDKATISEHDLSAQLTLARADLRTFAAGLQHAWDLDLGYGPGAITWTPRVSVSRVGSPVLSHGQQTDLERGYHTALNHIAAGHHHYGDLPAGQTIWPTSPLSGRDEDGVEHRRTVPIDEARRGVALLDLALAELQRTRHDLGAQEIAVALAVAEEGREALKALPTYVWERPSQQVRVCVGVPTRSCGMPVRDKSTRCWACRARLVRMRKAS